MARSRPDRRFLRQVTAAKRLAAVQQPATYPDGTVIPEYVLKAWGKMIPAAAWASFLTGETDNNCVAAQIYTATPAEQAWMRGSSNS